jgi:hypothetical protein
MSQFFVWLRYGWGQRLKKKICYPVALLESSLARQPSPPRNLPGPSTVASSSPPWPVGGRLLEHFLAASRRIGNLPKAAPPSPLHGHRIHGHRIRRRSEQRGSREQGKWKRNMPPPCPMSPVVAPELLSPTCLGFCISRRRRLPERESEETRNSPRAELFFFSRAVRE